MDGNIVAQENIIKIIIKTLTSYRNSQKEYAGIEIWSNEVSVCTNIQNQDFIDLLKSKLDDNDLRSFSKDIACNNSQQEQNLQHITVNTPSGELYLHLKPLLPRISAIKGSMMEKEYKLDWKKTQRWTVGRGLLPSSTYQVYEKNSIVINDNEIDPTIQYINEHVSSYHASITYEKGGFYLMAEAGGVDYTKLLRKGSEFMFRSEIKMLLEDNDMIKLGSSDHHVLLQFKLS